MLPEHAYGAVHPCFDSTVEEGLGARGCDGGHGTDARCGAVRSIAKGVAQFLRDMVAELGRTFGQRQWTLLDKPHREPGIRRDARGRIRAYVGTNGQLCFKHFLAGTPLAAVRRWRFDTRASLELNQRPSGTFAGDIEAYLRQIADRPRLVAERRQQLGMVGGAAWPPPPRCHRVRGRAGRARGPAPDPCGLNVQPLPPSAFLPVPGARWT